MVPKTKSKLFDVAPADCTSVHPEKVIEISGILADYGQERFLAKQLKDHVGKGITLAVLERSLNYFNNINLLNKDGKIFSKYNSQLANKFFQYMHERNLEAALEVLKHIFFKFRLLAMIKSLFEEKSQRTIEEVIAFVGSIDEAKVYSYTTVERKVKFIIAFLDKFGTVHYNSSTHNILWKNGVPKDIQMPLNEVPVGASLEFLKNTIKGTFENKKKGTKADEALTLQEIKIIQDYINLKRVKGEGFINKAEEQLSEEK